MTLTDIFELKKQACECSTIQEVQELLDDNGEDNDFETAERIYRVLNTESSKNAFSVSGNVAVLNGKVIKCPDCPNSSTDKILSNPAEVLSASQDTYFGCCECGTTFKLKMEN